MEYEILKYRPELKDQILKLQTNLWSPDIALNAAYFDWKYLQNPYSDLPLIYVALRDGQVVGMRGMMGAAWQRDRASHAEICPCAADVVMVPQHRNRGLFHALTQVALQDAADCGYPFAFNLSAGSATMISSLAMGWRSVGKLQAMSWGHPTKAALKLIQGRTRNLLKGSWGQGNVFSRLDQNSRKDAPTAGLEISVHPTASPDEMYGLAACLSGPNGLSHKIDPQYFAWRFRNPLANYRFVLSTSDQLEGYLVLQSSVHQMRSWVGVVDWAAANKQVLTDLLNATIHWGEFAELRIWSNTLSEEERAVFLAAGFYDLKEPSIKESMTTILVTSTNPEIPPRDWVLDDGPLLEFSQWNVRMIYSDNF